MNFEEALRHMQEGTATDEEKAFVEGRLQNENAGLPSSDGPRIIEKPKPAKIKGQKRELGKFYKLVICVAAVFVALGTIFAGVFGSAAASASKKDNLNKAEAGAIAKEFALEFARDSQGLPQFVNDEGDFIVRDIDRDLKYNAAKPSESYYVYEVQLVTMGIEIDVVVSSLDSTCKVKEIDWR